MDELTALDYITKPVVELAKHESFSNHAYRVAIAFLDLKTTQLENIDIPGVVNG